MASGVSGAKMKKARTSAGLNSTGWLLCWGVRCQALQTLFGRSEFADVARRGHASLRDRRCWPSQDGIRRMRRTNLGQRASRQTWRQHKPANGLASSIVPAGHRSADRRNPRFLLVRFYGSEEQSSGVPRSAGAVSAPYFREPGKPATVPPPRSFRRSVWLLGRGQ